jgi:peptidyl-prolyl cis-trans isomerase C
MKKLFAPPPAGGHRPPLLPAAAIAQNVATVNGKPVPKSRVETLIQQVTRGGQQQRTPELEAQVRDEVVLREMFMQEAEKRGLPAVADYKTQMELARQSILIRELFEDYRRRTRSPTPKPRPSTTSSRPRPAAANTAPATSWSRRKKTPRP